MFQPRNFKHFYIQVRCNYTDLIWLGSHTKPPYKAQIACGRTHTYEETPPRATETVVGRVRPTL